MHRLILIAMAASMTVHASSLDKSAKIEQAIVTNAQESQKTVSKSSDTAFELQDEIDSLQEEIRNLTVYQTHLNTLLQSQDRELLNLNDQLNEIAETRQSTIPLMYDMLAELEKYVQQDIPILKEARIERVAKLNELMTNSKISDAEKYRRILEAYQIELDYVNKLGTYTQPIEINGEKRETEQLYLGHVSLIARSLNRDNYWYWNRKLGEWVTLDRNTHTELSKAFDIANKLVTPDILMLPLTISEVVR